MPALDLSVDVGARLSVAESMLDGQGFEDVQAILQEIVYSWREIMQDLWPRDTGLSFSMWRSVVSGLSLVVENPVEYASYVHAEGEEEGASGEQLAEALDQLIDAASGQILQAVTESGQRGGAGLASTARQVSGPDRVIGGGISAARARVFEATGGRELQRAALPGVRLGAEEARQTINRTGGVLVRFRERTRTRVR